MMQLLANHLVVQRGNGGLRTPVSFDLRSGQVLFVYGANGSGKTTLLKALAGILSDNGAVKYRRADSSDWDSLEERRLTIGASVDPVFWPHTTPRQILEDQCWLYGIDTAALSAVCEQLGIVNLLDEQTSVLSTGELTRLSIARALVTRPRLLILDEPERGLDQEGIATLTQVVSQFQDMGGIAIIATHHPDWALSRSITLNLG